MQADHAVAPSSTRRAIDIRRFPWIRRIAGDYAYNYSSLAPFFSGKPDDDETWRQAIARAQAHPRRRDLLAEVISSQQRRRGAPAAALAASERLRDPRTVAIVTGQQAGLFGGPLYTLLKALTAVKLARSTAASHDVPTVAVFWIDAEDHDWDEVSACGVLDAELEYRLIQLPKPSGAGEVPVASVRLEPSIGGALDELARALPQTEFTPALLEDLGRCYSVGTGMAEAFGRWIEVVLGHLGLVVFDCADPAAKPLAAGVFSRELRSGQSSALAMHAGSEMATRGYHAQVTLAPNSVSLFHLDGTRHPIRRSDGQFLIGDRSRPADALVDEANHRPERFSPNVLLRPIVQDTLFPTACYVAGPSELAYLGQLRGVYAHFEVPMPLIHPRATATILDSAAARFLARYDLPLEQLQPQDEAALNRLLQAHLPPAVEHSLEEAVRAVQVRMESVIGAVPLIDPTLEGAARSTLGRMEHDLRTLHNKIIQAAKRRDETLRRQFVRARAQAFPDGHPQERVLGFVDLLNRYGPALVDRLDEELPLDLGQHWILTI